MGQAEKVLTEWTRRSDHRIGPSGGPAGRDVAWRPWKTASGRIEDMSGFYSQATNEEELEGKHCDACGEWLDPSRTWCPTCGSDR